ncbi:MAG: hypothetical protein KC656_22070, partial [Myxococcales bacterium]|nr:hypothetical protein [Myxococcales bacterium]
ELDADGNVVSEVGVVDETGEIVFTREVEDLGPLEDFDLASIAVEWEATPPGWPSCLPPPP